MPLPIAIFMIVVSSFGIGWTARGFKVRRDMPEYWRWKLLTKPPSEHFEELYKPTGGGKMGW